MQELKFILWFKDIQRKRTNIYRAILEPITTFGAENWQVTSRTKESLKVVEMDFLKRVFSVRIYRLLHIRNEIMKRGQTLRKIL